VRSRCAAEASNDPNVVVLLKGQRPFLEIGEELEVVAWLGARYDLLGGIPGSGFDVVPLLEAYGVEK
jgi:hypothetical protein